MVTSLPHPCLASCAGTTTGRPAWAWEHLHECVCPPQGSPPLGRCALPSTMHSSTGGHPLSQTQTWRSHPGKAMLSLPTSSPSSSARMSAPQQPADLGEGCTVRPGHCGEGIPRNTSLLTEKGRSLSPGLRPVELGGALQPVTGELTQPALPSGSSHP